MERPETLNPLIRQFQVKKGIDDYCLDSLFLSENANLSQFIYAKTNLHLTTDDIKEYLLSKGFTEKFINEIWLNA